MYSQFMMHGQKNIKLRKYLTFRRTCNSQHNWVYHKITEDRPHALYIVHWHTEFGSISEPINFKPIFLLLHVQPATAQKYSKKIRLILSYEKCSVELSTTHTFCTYAETCCFKVTS